MAMYIDAEHLMNKIELMFKECTDKKVGVLTVLLRVVNAIMNCPTVDVEEVKHGEWLEYTNGNQKPIYRCSLCNERLIGYSDPSKVKYCHCGAKMDRGNNHE